MGRKPLPADERLERERIGATLRAIREAHRLTCDQVATAIGKSQPYLSNIEAGRKPLTWDLLNALTVALNVAPGAIVRNDYFEQAAA